MSAYYTVKLCEFMNNVLVVLSEQRVRRRSPNSFEVEIERADWLRAKSRAYAVRLIPIYTA